MNAAILLLFTLLVFCTQSVQAKPMYIEFTNMMQQAPTIVIAAYLGPVSPDPAILEQYNLIVHQVLKGKASGKMIVNRAHGNVSLKPNTKVIAFLNANNEFEWVAETNGTSLEKDLLFLRGFYDYNAYIVAPSSITLQQLQEYITTDHYTFKASGHLHFYDSKAQTMQPSKVHFSVQKQYPSGKQQVVANHLELGDFADYSPQMSMPEGREGIFAIEYESNMVRPLKFKASTQEFDTTTQQFKALFWVMAPEEMTEQLFKDYLAKPQYGHPYYQIEVKRKETNASYLFTYHKERGRIGTLKGYDNSLWECSSLGDPSDTKSSDIVFGYNKKDKVIIRLKKLTKMVAYYNYPYRQDRLIRILRVHPIEGQIIYKDVTGKEQVLEDCTIELKSTQWAKNVNYKE